MLNLQYIPSLNGKSFFVDATNDIFKSPIEIIDGRYNPVSEETFANHAKNSPPKPLVDDYEKYMMYHGLVMDEILLGNILDGLHEENKELNRKENRNVALELLRPY